MEVNFKVKGIEGITAALSDLPDLASQRAVLLRSMRKAAAPMLDTAKRRAFQGDDSGALSESLGFITASKTQTLKDNKVAKLYISPRRRWRPAVIKYIQFYYTRRGRSVTPLRVKQGIFHAHWVEWGSVHNTPKPFLRPAFDQQSGRFIDIFAATWGKEVKRQTEKIARKYARHTR